MHSLKIITAFVAALFIAIGSAGVASADVFNIDPGHSTVGFKVKHMVVSNVTGSFDTFEGVINFNADAIEKSSVEVKIAAASINTRSEKRDADLKGGEFLATEEFPDITFKSTSIKKSKNGFVATGNLTIHGVTKEVEIDFNVAGPVVNPWGKTIIGVEGTLEIDRQDYGVKWSKNLDSGGLVVSNTVKIELNIEAVKAEG